MSVKLKNKKRVLTDEEIEKYCYSVEQLLIDINHRSNVKRNKKTNTLAENNSSSVDDVQISSIN